MRKFDFNLQLFAESDASAAGAAAGELSGQNVPDGGEPTPNTPGNPDNAAGSILGNAGTTQNNGNNNAGNQQENGNNNAPDVYDFSAIVPQGMTYDEGAAREFGGIARECGLSQEQATKIAQYGMQYMQNGVSAAMQQIAATQERWGKEAREKLGADFDKTVARAAVGIDRLSKNIPGIREAFNETGAGNRIEMITLMAAIGDLLGEDGGHGAPGYGGEKSLYPNTNFGMYR